MLTLALALLLAAAAEPAPARPAEAAAARPAEPAAAKPAADKPAAASPAQPAPAPAKGAEPAPKAQDPNKPAIDPFVLDPHGHHHHGHNGKKEEEPPLTEPEKKVVKLADMFAAMTRDNAAAFEEMLKELQAPKDCAAAARKVAARAKKNDAEQAKKRKAADEAGKQMPMPDRQGAAGKALISLSGDLKKFRDGLPAADSTIAAFKGKCPKEGPEVEKLLAALRKRIAP